VIDLSVVDSPIGPLTVAVRSGKVCALYFGRSEPVVRAAVARWYGGEGIVHADDPGGAVTALDAYFKGDLAAIDAIDVELNGTPFQRRVWQALRAVRAGHPVSYSHLARTIGAPAAVRAVGAANGANPVAVIVPCHRVIGADGTLTGYGGGLETKRWLLTHESGNSPLIPVSKPLCCRSIG
jgi:methylated-DNA-[protein]-cysteine S-methyltransferase